MTWWDTNAVALSDLVLGLEAFSLAWNDRDTRHEYRDLATAFAAFAKGYVYARFGGLSGDFVDVGGNVREGQTIRYYSGDGLSKPMLQHILASKNVDALAALQPPIYNEAYVARMMHNLGVPKEQLAADVFEQARSLHRGFVAARNTALKTGAENNLRMAMRRLAALLYLVRNNLSHPGKSEFGYDGTKPRRDLEVVPARGTCIA